MPINQGNISRSIEANVFLNIAALSGNTTSSNTTSTVVQSWNASAVLRVILCILDISLNTSVILAIIPHKKLWTSFTVYIAFLLTTNAIYSAVLHPLEIVRLVYSKWWLSSRFCTLYLYLAWVFCAVPFQMHLHITINRIWAIAFPISYRQYHTAKVACMLCLGSIVYVHIVALPLVLIDQFLYWNRLEGGCLFNYNLQIITKYSSVVTFLLFVGPGGFVVFAYPFIYYKQTQRRKIGSVPNTKSSTDRSKETTKGSAGLKRNDKNERKTESSSVQSKPSGNAKDRSRAFVALTLLTMSAFVCWTPFNVYTILLGSVLPAKDMIGFRNVAVVLYGLMPILDPILFAVSLHSVRSFCRQKFCAGGP